MHHSVTTQLNVLFWFRVTNGGKTTLTNRLIETLPNCCVVHQDDFFKVSLREQVDDSGFCFSVEQYVWSRGFFQSATLPQTFYSVIDKDVL